MPYLKDIPKPNHNDEISKAYFGHFPVARQINTFLPYAIIFLS